METETIWLTDNGAVPNNPRLPVLVHRHVWPGGEAATIEAIFASHGWQPAWQNGINAALHFHSTAHEVLGIVIGSAQVQLGDATGPTCQVQAGDVLVLPAGTGHRRVTASPDLLVVGAYAAGHQPDMCDARPEAAPAARARIARLPDPPGCPVRGQAYPRRP
jgi:uncharacterized protein YjlB